MFLSDAALQELNKIIEDEYGFSLDCPDKNQILKNLGESLLQLLAAAIKARSRAHRLGINILPSCLEDRSEQRPEQQSFLFDGDEVNLGETEDKS